ncbi:MAG: GDP-mannose 4,6-dehydratase [Magnetococcus sp. WYHC-3]
MSNPKKALIFGISGQDGAYLARWLLSHGYGVHGTSRDREAAGFGNLRALGILDQVVLHSAVLLDFRSLFQVLNQVRPSEVYNLAGQTSVGLSFQQPIETFESIALGTLNIMECLRLLELPARFFNAASSECFGDVSEPVTESSPLRPRSPYAMAKAAAFWNVANYREAYNLFACSGILFNHESPLRPARFVTRKIISAAVRIARGSQERLKLGNLDVYRDWGWAPEYMEAVWRMLQHHQPEDFIIATGHTHALRDFVDITFRALGLNWHDHVDIDRSLLRPSDLVHVSADPSKIAARLGWRAEVGFAELIDRMIAAEQQAEVPSRG